MILLSAEEEILYNDVHNVEEFTVDINGGSGQPAKSMINLQKDLRKRAGKDLSSQIKVEPLSDEESGELDTHG